MTRVLLTASDSTQIQIPFKTNTSFYDDINISHSEPMNSNNQNVEVTLHDSLGQITIPTSVPLPLINMVNENSRQEQDSVTTHHQQNGSSMSITMTNGNIGNHQSLQHNLMANSLSSQTHTLELHPSFVTNILEEPEIRPHMCELCQATYKTRTHLRRHMFIHLTSRPYPCQDCGKGFNRKEHLNKHTEAVHSGTKYKCPYCNKEISRKDHLSRHIKNMHLAVTGSQMQLRNIGEGEPLHQPANSKQRNSSNKQQKLHRPLPSGLTITSLNQPLTNSTMKLQNNVPNRYLSNPCSLNMDVQLSFNNSSHHNSALDKKLLLQLFSCPDCSATFTSDRDLSIHSRVHKPQPYKCNECARAYTRREKLTEHVRCFHQGQKFSCEYCGKELSRKDHVLRHVRSVHPEVLATRFVAIANGDGNFDSTSSQIRSLNSTAPLNGNNSNNIPSMGEMGVLLRSVCHICLKVFGTSYHLCRHMESCHNGDVRPYSCSSCSKQFKRKDHLTKHMKSHCPSMRDTSASTTFRSITRAVNNNTPIGDESGNTLESSTLNAFDTAELMQQDAIDSLQIEMMTDADDETDSNSNDEDEDSKELPGLIVETPVTKSTGGNSIKKKTNKVESLPPLRNEYTLAGFKSLLSESNGGGNENSLIHLQMDTSDNLRSQSTKCCGHCQKEFNSKSRLLQHLQEHSNSDLKVIQSQAQNSLPVKAVTVTPVTNANSDHISVSNLWSS